MAQPELTPQLTTLLEEAVTALFCRVDDTYYTGSTPKGDATRATRTSKNFRILRS
jgi:hypothetical protein